jgi:cytochrome P450
MKHPRPRIETPPGPPPRRGVLDSARYFYKFATDAIGFVGERFERYGDLYYAPSEGGGLYVLRHPDHIRQVLVTDAASYAKKHSAFDRLEEVLGTGLLTSDGATWKRHRRMIQPSFQPKRLAEYAAVMEEEAWKWGERWRDASDCDASHDMMELTLRIVGRTLFNHDVSEHASAVRRSMETLTEEMVRPDLLPAWVPSFRRRRLERAVADLDRIIYDMIDRRRSGPGNDGAETRGDLLGALASAVDAEGDGGRLSEREVRDELVTMFLAGHETTSQALTWTWYLLSQNPEAEIALHEEVDRLGTERLGYEDLDDLPYTHQVISEAMRLYPPAFVIARRAHRDTELGSWQVPAGSEVVVWTYFTHRDARWYPDPEAFLPERFAPAARAKLPQQAYLPFGAGSRACIGTNFAMIEAVLILATLARRFRLRLAAGQRVALKPRVTLTPAHGMRMQLEPRVS